MSGFDNRVFLTEEEYRTYKRRMPVRYIKHKKQNLCCVCGEEGTTSKPLENAHILGFRYGILDLRLTPDFLDRPENIKTAHRGRCNAAVELDLEQAKASIPTYNVELRY